MKQSDNNELTKFTDGYPNYHVPSKEVRNQQQTFLAIYQEWFD